MTSASFDADTALQRLDAFIEAQLEAILAHPTFVALERRWRSLAWLVENLDPADGTVVAILPVTVDELTEDAKRATRERALLRVLVRDPYQGGVTLPWTLIALADEVDEASLVDALAQTAEASTTVALLDASAALAARWRPLELQEHHRYAALLSPPVRDDVPASHAALAALAQSFARYRHEAWSVGPHGRLALASPVPHRDDAAAQAFARRGIASWSTEDDAVSFTQLPCVALPRDLEGVGPHDGWVAAQLPYLLFALRFVRIVRLTMRDLDPAADRRLEVERRVHHYVNDALVHDDGFNRAHPLRTAKVREVAGDLWLGITPRHMKVQGALVRVWMRLPGPENEPPA